MSADLVLIAGPQDAAWIAGWQRLRSQGEIPHQASWDNYLELRRRLALDMLANCWVGQVSWLGGLFDDNDERYIPGPVQRIDDLVGEGRTLTLGLIAAIQAEMNLPNRSIYGRREVVRYDPDTYDRIVRANSRTVRGLGHGLILYRKPSHDSVYSGLVRRRVLKNWLEANIGAYLVAESE
jgi:hypothetical protein